jgi:hypothetical protein
MAIPNEPVNSILAVLSKFGKSLNGVVSEKTGLRRGFWSGLLDGH